MKYDNLRIGMRAKLIQSTYNGDCSFSHSHNTWSKNFAPYIGKIGTIKSLDGRSVGMVFENFSIGTICPCELELQQMDVELVI